MCLQCFELVVLHQEEVTLDNALDYWSVGRLSDYRAAVWVRVKQVVRVRVIDGR